MKKAVITTLLALAFFNALAFENTGLKALSEGRAEYYCTLNRENPKQKDTYDQPVFAGAAFAGKNNEVVLVSPKGKISSGFPKEFSLEDAKNLEGTIMVSMSLTAENEVKNDLDRNISMTIGRFKNPYKLQKGEDLVDTTIISSGYHKGSVMLIYKPAKLSLTCWHKNRLGIN